MAMGSGIAALVVSIICIFIPLPMWLYVSWGALLLASIGALYGDKTFAISTTILVIVNTALLSPITLAFLCSDNGGFLRFIHITAIVVPIAVIILNASGKIVLNSTSQAQGNKQIYS